ncbi:F-box domain-containing protein [Mycena indigotica]|uniref:F-box domain-containing protein n=1 Tax=Mycena indigotica TaxID=2126181 RepID=A0A8H6WBJ4_9AGAR|nr:F-box domain-containing protein [Mycena indigotica]KAF7312689.1 F-box domain-containing protein [Mycena indigotica]
MKSDSCANALKKIPAELLYDSEIFAYACEDYTWSIYRTANGITELAAVCKRWRAVLLDAPLLWSKIDMNMRFRKPEIEQLVDLHLQRSQEAPIQANLSFSSDEPWSYRVLHSFLAQARRLRVLAIHDHSISNPRYIQTLLSFRNGFPMLRRLGIHYHRLTRVKDAEIDSFFDKLPVLKDLTLNLYSNRMLLSATRVFRQLDRCELAECWLRDILLVLPYFNVQTHLKLSSCRRRRDDIHPTGIVTSVSELWVTECTYTFTDLLLENIITPNLQHLKLSSHSHPRHFLAVEHLLQRSSCCLTHLTVAAELFPPKDAVSDFGANILYLLGSSMCTSITDLDVDVGSHGDALESLLAKLGDNSEYIPRLHTLTLRSAWSVPMKLLEATILKAHCQRKGRWMRLVVNNLSILSKQMDNIQNLKDNGLKISTISRSSTC